MSVNTILFDFSLEPNRVSGDVECKSIIKQVVESLKSFFNNPVLLFESSLEDGYTSVFKEGCVVFNIRLFHQGLLTLNIDYYKNHNDPSIISFDVCYIF